MVSSVRIGHLAFNQQPQCYQESVKTFRPNNNCKIEVRPSEEHNAHSDISVGNFVLPFKTFISKISRSIEQKLTMLPFNSNRNFPNLFGLMVKNGSDTKAEKSF